MADTAGSSGLDAHARYEKRQDAKAQRRKAAEDAQVAEGNDTGVWVPLAIICSDPQQGDEIQPLTHF